VVFNVTSGGGTIVGNSEVETNQEGIAQISWKLGTQAAGNQRILAKVKKFNGNYLEGNPIEFTATIGCACEATTSIGCGCGTTTYITDASGNEYPVVQIGDQCWTKKNLRTSKYADGSVIPNVTSPSAWADLSTGAWYHYNDSIYGKLYNWYTVSDPRKVCPTGWHVPTDSEWTVLIDFLGGEDVAGGKMKATSVWYAPNTAATNESCFSGLPGGYRWEYNGDLLDVGTGGSWWSSSGSNTLARRVSLGSSNGNTGRHYDNPKSGSSIRCLKD
jgi:uncharacterized protein (TIGR02145 family)